MCIIVSMTENNLTSIKFFINELQEPKILSRSTVGLNRLKFIFETLLILLKLAFNKKYIVEIGLVSSNKNDQIVFINYGSRIQTDICKCIFTEKMKKNYDFPFFIFSRPFLFVNPSDKIEESLYNFIQLGLNNINFDKKEIKEEIKRNLSQKYFKTPTVQVDELDFLKTACRILIGLEIKNMVWEKKAQLELYLAEKDAALKWKNSHFIFDSEHYPRLNNNLECLE